MHGARTLGRGAPALALEKPTKSSAVAVIADRTPQRHTR